jgi:hypothetical protein
MEVAKGYLPQCRRNRSFDHSLCRMLGDNYQHGSRDRIRRREKGVERRQTSEES